MNRHLLIITTQQFTWNDRPYCERMEKVYQLEYITMDCTNVKQISPSYSRVASRKAQGQCFHTSEMNLKSWTIKFSDKTISKVSSMA